MCFTHFIPYIHTMQYAFEYKPTPLVGIYIHLRELGFFSLRDCICGYRNYPYIEEFCLLGYNAMQSVGSPSTFYFLWSWFVARPILRLWRQRRYIPPKRLNFSGPHRFTSISQKGGFLIATVVRTSNIDMSVSAKSLSDIKYGGEQSHLCGPRGHSELPFGVMSKSNVHLTY
jgi:hypothetical protein